MPAEVAHVGALPDRRRFRSGDAGTGRVEVVGRRIGVSQAREQPGLPDVLVDDKCISAEVGHHGVGRATAAIRMPNRVLDAAEHALESVGRGRNAWVIEAEKEVGAVAAGASHEVINEVACLGAQSRSWSRVCEVLEVGIEAHLGFGGCRGSILAIGRVGQLVRDPANDGGVTLDASGGSCFMPGRLECLG